MAIKEVRLKLEPNELPEGFTYPASFLEFVRVFPQIEDEFDPWGLIADTESNKRYSEEFGSPLVKFGQAWLEDMIACFVVDSSSDPAVVVINPWQQRMVAGNAERYCMLVEHFPNFAGWLEWMRASELVRDYAATRAEQSSGTDGKCDSPSSVHTNSH